MAKAKKASERRKKDVTRKPNRRKRNVEGNWRGIEDRFFTKVRDGFKRILSPPK